MAKLRATDIINSADTNPAEQSEPIKASDVIKDVDRFAGPSLQKEYDLDISEYTDQIQNVYPDQNINEQRAYAQSDWGAVANSFGQLVTGTIGELVATPGYASSLFEPIEEMDEGFSSAFIDAGNWIKSLGEEYAPIYQSQATQDAVFAPFNGEWWANTIAQFGPTIALMGATLATEGMATPALLGRLGQLSGKAGRLARNAKAFYTSGTKGANLLRTTNATIISRLTEGGMEAHQSFLENYDRIKQENPELSDEAARKQAGEIAAQVWRKNWMLAALDFMQFKGLIDGFGKFGKAFGVFGEMGSEAVEEGVQYAIGKEATLDAQAPEGTDVSLLKTFFDSLEDREMQQAMVQGALGGGVFAGVGALAEKVVKRYQAKTQEELVNASLDTIEELDKEGRLPVVQKAIEKALQDPDISDEHRKHILQKQKVIANYVANKQTVVEPNPVVKKAKVKAATKQVFTQANLNASKEALATVEAMLQEQDLSPAEAKKSSLRAQITALKNAPEYFGKQKLMEVLQTELKELEADGTVAVKKTGIDSQLKKAAEEKIEAEILNDMAKQENATVNTAKGEQEIIDTAKKEEKAKVDTAEQQEQRKKKEDAQDALKAQAAFELPADYQQSEESKVPQTAETVNLDEALDEASAMQSLADDITAEEAAKPKYTKSRSTIEDMIRDFSGDFMLDAQQLEKTNRRTNKMVKLLMELAEDLDNNPTFDDVVAAFEEVKGEELSMKFKKKLAALYFLTTDIEVTLPNEQIDTVVQIPAEHYSIDDNEVVEAEINNIEQSLAQANADNPDATATFEYKRVQFGSNLIAYLSRVFEQVRDAVSVKRNEISDSLNEDMLDKNILDAKQFGEGTELTLKVVEDDQLQYYIPNSDEKETVSWAALKSQLPMANSEGFVLTEEDMTPIGIYKDGKLVAFLHTVDWIKEENVYGSIEKDVKDLRELRKAILEQGEVKTTISSRSPGYLFRTKDNTFMPVAEAHPDSKITVVRNGSRIGVKGDRLLNLELKEGYTYSVITVGDKTMEIPVKQKRLSEEHIESVVNAVEIFVDRNNLNDEQQRTLAKFKAAGYDLSTYEGMSDYMSLFLYNFNPDVFNDLRSFVKANPISSDTYLISLSGNEVQFNTTANVTKSLSANTPADMREKLIGDLRKILAKHYYHTAATKLNSKVAIPVMTNAGFRNDIMEYNEFVKQNTTSNIIGHNIGTEESPNYVYTIQSKIRIDTSFAENKDKVSENREGTKGEQAVPTSDTTQQLKELVASLYPKVKESMSEEEFTISIMNPEDGDAFIDILEANNLLSENEIKQLQELYKPYQVKAMTEMSELNADVENVSQFVDEGLFANFDPDAVEEADYLLGSEIQIYSDAFNQDALSDNDLAIFLLNNALGLNIKSIEALTWNDIKDAIIIRDENGNLTTKLLGWIGGDSKMSMSEFVNQKGLSVTGVFIGDAHIYPNVTEILTNSADSINKAVFQNLFSLSGAFDQIKDELNNSSAKTFIISTPNGKFTLPKRFAAGFYNLATKIQTLTDKNLMDTFVSYNRQEQVFQSQAKEREGNIITTYSVESPIVKNAIATINNEIIREAVAKNEKLKIKVFDNASFSKDGSAGFYMTKENTIYIHSSLLERQRLGEGMQVLSHELVHAATAQALRYNDKFKNSVLQLLNKVKEAQPKNKAYGLSNSDEFLAEAFSNPVFIRLLKNTTFSKTQRLTLWQKLLNEIYKVFKANTPYQETTTTTSALQELETIISANKFSIGYISLPASETLNAKNILDIKPSFESLKQQLKTKNCK